MTTPRVQSQGRPTLMSRRHILSALLSACAGLAVTSHAGPSRAQAANWEHVINLAGRQRMLSQRMSKEIMLIALQYNVRENVRNLLSNSEEFGRVLRALRHGDIDLALAPAIDPTIVEKLSQVERLWPLFDVHVAEVIAAGTVSPRQLQFVAETNLPLLQAMDETVKVYETSAGAGQMASMLAVAVNMAGTQRMLSQKMSKELYLVALDYDAAANRQLMAHSARRFDQILNGLMLGDSDLLLLPAPTAEIKARLDTVQRLWSAYRPMISDAAAGAAVDADMIAETASLNLSLLDEMNTAVGQYVALRPQNRTDTVPPGGSDTRQDGEPRA